MRYESPVTAVMPAPTIIAKTPHHLGASPSSARRPIRKNTARQIMNTITPMNSSVMPEVMWPKPLKMRSQCCRCMKTDRPPRHIATNAAIIPTSWVFLPLPVAVSRPCTNRMPLARHTKNVKRMRGQCSSIGYSLHSRPSRNRYISLGSLPLSMTWWMSESLYAST